MAVPGSSTTTPEPVTTTPVPEATSTSTLAVYVASILQSVPLFLVLATFTDNLLILFTLMQHNDTGPVGMDSTLI